ncbi:MAG: PAS domain S-box protein [Anaerolineae bacterium]
MASSSLKILFVDDSQSQYDMIKDLLGTIHQQTIVLDWSAEYQDALDKLLQGSYDAALIDFYLSGKSGLELIEEALAKGCKSPLIIITGRGDADLDAEVMKSRAADYLEKSDLRPSTLVRSIRYAIERASAMNKLRESEERYRDLFENSSDLIQSFDDTGRFIYVNRAWKNSLGYSDDDLSTLNLFKIIHPAHVEQCRKICQQILEQTQASPVETIFIAKDGREVIVEGNITVKLGVGTPPIIRGIFHDITERKQAEKALKASEERLRMVLNSLPVFLFTIDPDGSFRQSDGRMNEIPSVDATALYGMPVRDIFANVLGYGLEHPVHFHITKALAGDSGDVIINILDHSFEVHYGPIRNEKGEFIGAIGISTDVTALKQAEAAEHQQRLLAEALYNTAAAINSTLHFDEILDRILANVGKVFPHDVAEIMMIEGDSGVIVRSRSNWDGVTARPATRLPIETTKNLHDMATSRQPMIIPDTQHYPGWVDVPESRWMRSYAGIPIQSEGKVIGFLNLGSKTPGFFSSEIINNLQVYTDQIAIALQNARFVEQAQELAALNERQRLARELHDAVSQTLFSASVIAEALPRIAKDLPQTVEDALGELHQLNRRALAEMRSLLLELRPKALLETKLEDLLRQLAETFVSRVPLQMQSQIVPDITVSQETKLALYRIAQEALNNIAKHARATTVTLTLAQDSDNIRLQVQDNGRGFNAQDTLPDSFGLSIMKERAKTIGGTLVISSVVGQGTTITVTLPVVTPPVEPSDAASVSVN